MGNAVGIPLNARIELQRWLRRIYLEFRAFDLRILLADCRLRSGPIPELIFWEPGRTWRVSFAGLPALALTE